MVYRVPNRRACQPEREIEIICRRFRPEDKAAVLSVLGASYGGWHGEENEAFWTWKFERNPHGQARIYVGDDGGRIAGCYILNPVMLRVGETTIHGAQAVDAAVSPDYRGRGVLADLAQTALKEADDDGIKLIFAFPSQGAFGGQVRVGFKPHMVVPKTYRPLLGPTRRRRFAGLTLGEANTFDARFDVFSKRGRDCEVSVQRDRDFLQWRYHEHPTQTYDTLTCERDGDICGYSVLTIKATRNLVSPGYVVDLQVSPESKSAAMFLAYHSLRHLRSLGARVGVSWERPSGTEQEALRSVGFSSRYASIRRRLTRPTYVDQLIVFDAEDKARREARPNCRGADSPRWSLVPGDADYI